jgi:ParB-like chromosome segregation protein Spo0J
MKQATTEIHEIDPERIRVFVHRKRDQAAFALSVEDTKRRGQIEPGEVRDIRHLPREERKRPNGGYFDYELVVGEGRLLRAKALGVKFRTFIVSGKEVDSVGRFLSENLNRVALPWAQKARLVQPLLQSGIEAQEIASRHSLTVGHVLKFKRILDKTATGLEREIDAMPMNEAEEFTSLPPEHQVIVMQAFRETKAGTIRELTKKAKAVAEEQGGELSSVALRKSLERVDEDLKRMRERLKLTRLHWSLAVPNLSMLLDDKKFRKALDAEGVNVAKFEQITSEP